MDNWTYDENLNGFLSTKCGGYILLDECKSLADIVAVATEHERLHHEHNTGTVNESSNS